MTAERIIDAELAELRRLHETAHSWDQNAVSPGGPTHEVYDVDDGETIALAMRVQDAALIVAARNALPRMIDEIDRLRELVRDVAQSGIVWQAGAKYLEVQIGTETWKALQAELEKKP